MGHGGQPRPRAVQGQRPREIHAGSIVVVSVWNRALVKAATWRQCWSRAGGASFNDQDSTKVRVDGVLGKEKCMAIFFSCLEKS